MDTSSSFPQKNIGIFSSISSFVPHDLNLLPQVDAIFCLQMILSIFANMRTINKNTLVELTNLLHERSEICGIVIPGNNELELQGLDVGPYIKDGERGSCRSTNVWINFHTHPMYVWPWPSTEDVFKVLYDHGAQKPVLWGSLIFTEWGVWEIHSPTKIFPDDLNEDFEWWTVNASDKLFFDLNLSKRKTAPSSQEAEKYIREYVNLWNDAFGPLGFEMQITFWENIPGDYTLQTGLASVPLPNKKLT